jgi:hypothetical protein
MAKRKEKRGWIVRVRCECTKDLFLEDCTEEQAKADPWTYVVDETELDCDYGDFYDLRPND